MTANVIILAGKRLSKRIILGLLGSHIRAKGRKVEERSSGGAAGRRGGRGNHDARRARVMPHRLAGAGPLGLSEQPVQEVMSATTAGSLHDADFRRGKL